MTDMERCAEKIGFALLREFGWTPFDPRRGGNPNRLAGWERIGKVVLESGLVVPTDDYQAIADERERLHDRLVAMNECVRIYVGRDGDVRAGWLEEEIAMTDDLLRGGRR